MTAKKGLELTDSQQLLLCRYFDNECTCVGRFLAQRLLGSRTEAREYLESLRRTGMSCRDAMSCGHVPHIDIWNRIEARIEAEERAAIFLGARNQEGNRPRWGRVSTSQVFLGGLSGAAVTAMALLLVTNPSNQSNYPTIATGASNPGASQFTQVGLGRVPGTKSLRARPVGLSDQSGASSALEVDWMRANGPLRFIQNPGQRSSIIWVTKKSLSSALPNRMSASVAVTPTIASGAISLGPGSLGAVTPPEGIDGLEFGNSK
jgi:hypothetical protein